MADPISLAERRWDRGDGTPSSHSPRDVLEMVLAKIDSGALEVDHVVVIWARERDNVGDDGYFQAGSFGPFAQVGVVHRICSLMMDGDE